MRHGGSIDILASIEPLLLSVPNLQITLIADSSLRLEDPAQAQVLLRCVQELITNTIKHASAKKVELTLQKLDNLLILKSEDDGIGVNLAKLGNGLQGMKERVAELNGQMLIQTSPNHGFSVSITLPLGA